MEGTVFMCVRVRVCVVFFVYPVSFSKTRSLCPLLLLWIYFMLDSFASTQHSCVT